MPTWRWSSLVPRFCTPTSGKVLVDGDEILRMPLHRRTRWGLRRSFQREQAADDLTVWENVLAITDSLPGSRSDRRTEAEQAMDFAGVGKLRHRLGASLNTYERRLTDLARCFAGRPRLIKLDEPAGGLSLAETDHLRALVVRMAQLSEAKVLVIDHDVDLIQRICSETLVLDFGRRIAFGPTREVLNDPAVTAVYLGPPIWGWNRLELSGLSVTRQGRVIVDDVSLTVEPGKVTALLGPNGAGKSELVLGIAGLLPVTGARSWRTASI